MRQVYKLTRELGLMIWKSETEYEGQQVKERKYSENVLQIA